IVRLRIGEHAGYSRLVFDWPGTVSYRVTQSGDSATVSFEAPGRLMLDGAVNRMPEIIRDFVAGTNEMQPSLTLQLKPGTRIKDFRDGTRIVLDLSADGAASVAQAVPSDESSSAAPLNLLPEIATPKAEAVDTPHTAKPGGSPAKAQTGAG